MDETLRQLGKLLLDSIPTIICFVVVYLGYKIIVHKPLVRILEERRAQTQGAMEKARADVAAAEAKTAAYEQQLREAKLAVFKAQETRRQQALQVRTDILNQAREQATAKVAAARKAIEGDVEAAKAGLQADAEKLANDVIATVLRPALAQTPVGGAQ
ncbi:MAG TPA: ATP synthase F0 subunit B [Terriglobales bacterium]|nr:ATP synthase F0 subunit B [Terriglobales bacterium]